MKRAAAAAATRASPPQPRVPKKPKAPAAPAVAAARQSQQAADEGSAGGVEPATDAAVPVAAAPAAPKAGQQFAAVHGGPTPAAVDAAVPMEADPPAGPAAADAVLAEPAAAAGKVLPGAAPAHGALQPWAAPIPGGPASTAAARVLHPNAVPTAGSGSTSTRDMLRSVFNRIKLLHPVAARLETPNSVSDLLGALARHFGPAMALTTEQLVRSRARSGLRAMLGAGSVRSCLHARPVVPRVSSSRPHPQAVARAARAPAARQGCQRRAGSSVQLGTGPASDARRGRALLPAGAAWKGPHALRAVGPHRRAG